MSVLTPIVQTWDFVNRRIYLKAGVSEFFPIEDLYHEHRNIRRTDETKRGFDVLLRAEGNVAKGAGAFTPRYVVLLDGAKIVPFNDTVQINQLGDIITDDPDVDPSLYDISTLTVAKPIFIKPSEAETIQLNSLAIEFGEYSGSSGNGVTIDTVNGSPGVVYPVGTARVPSNNLTDALAICEERGFRLVYTVNALTLNSGDWSAGYTFIGQNATVSSCHIDLAAIVDNCEFRELNVTGTVDDNNLLRNCLIGDINSFDGIFYTCAFSGTVSLGGTVQTTVIDSSSAIAGGGATPIFVLGSGSGFAVRGWKGGLELKGKTGIDGCSIDIDSGQCIVAADCIAGEIFVRGNARLLDLSADGCKVDGEGLQTGTRTVKAVGYVTIESTGEAGTTYPIGSESFPVNNMADALAIAARDDVSIIHIHDACTTAGTEDLTGITIRGQSGAFSQLILTVGTVTTTTVIQDIYVTGVFTGTNNVLERCIVDVITGFTGFMVDCFIRTSVTAAGNIQTKECAITVDAISAKVTFDFQGNAIRWLNSGWKQGQVSVNNMIMGAHMHLAGEAGVAIVEANCTGGMAAHGGAVRLTNLGSGMMVMNSTTASQVWDIDVTGYVTEGTAGKAIAELPYIDRSVYIDTEALVNGIGSQSEPFDNVTDAIDFAEANNIRQLTIFADLILDRNLKNFVITGVGAPIIDLNGQDLKKSEFTHCKLKGAYIDSIIAKDCSFIASSTINGFFENCVFALGTYSIPSLATALIKNSAALVTGQVKPTFDLGLGTVGHLVLMGYEGGATIINCDQITDDAKIIMDGGIVELAASCTAGEISIGGEAKIIRNENGAAVFDFAIDPTDVQNIPTNVWNHTQ